MPITATVELRGLEIETDIGTYGPDDVVPDTHILDLSLTIAAERAVIPRDGMDLVFDYDPLVKDIDRLARDGHYHTQERLLTRIIEACARYVEIEAVTATLSKSPVLGNSGQLGVHICVDRDTIGDFRTAS